MTPVDNQVDVLRPQPEVGRPGDLPSVSPLETFSTNDLPSGLQREGDDPRILLEEIAEGED